MPILHCEQNAAGEYVPTGVCVEVRPALDPVDVLRATALPFLPTDRADEIARNVAMILDDPDARYWDVLEAVKHRWRHFELPCTDPDELAMALWLAVSR